MTSEIDKLKHFHVEDYSGIYFTDELNAGEEFLYTTIGIKDDKEVTFLPVDILINVIYYHIKLIKDGLLVLQ